MNTTTQERSITAADLAAAAEVTQRTIEASHPAPRSDDEPLAPLFTPDAAQDFRAQWDGVQISFVDDPQQAVRRADELVAQVMKSLADTFSTERAKLEAELDATEQASTENLRVALRRYRSFFQRLLSL
ncbi:MAG TPA: hypothetical protein VJ608_12570 [Albitalea sp.]|nr:hypothetical protein [Albitalea sp.]